MVRPPRVRGENEVLTGCPRHFSSMSKEVIIIGAGPGGLASAILLAASGVKSESLRAPADGRRTHLVDRGGRLQVRSRPHVFPLPARARGDLRRCRHLSSRRGGDGAARSAIPHHLRRRRRVRMPRRTSRAWSSRSRRIAPGDAPGFRRFLDGESRRSSAAWSRAWRRRSSAGRTSSICVC